MIAAMLPAVPAMADQNSPAVLRQTQGYVVVVIPRVLGKRQPTVTLQAVPGNGPLFTLVPTAANSEVLAAWVPQGSYEIEEMVRTSKSKYVPVEVKAGFVTDMGGLTWVSVGDDESRFMPLRHSDLISSFNGAVEPVKEFLASERLEWRPTAPPVGRAIPNGRKLPAPVLEQLAAHDAAQKRTPLREQLRQVKSLDEFAKLYVASSTPLLGETSSDKTGALYVGANFGQLRKREVSGAWHSIDTGTISPITAVEAAADPILVGTHNGLLLASGDNAQTWKRLHNFGTHETVLGIHFTGAQYLILTAKLVNPAAWERASLQSLQIYALDLPALSAPTLIRKIDLPKNYAQQRTSAYHATLAGKYYLVNTFEGIERFDLAARTWKTISPGHEVSNLRSANSGALITAFKAQGGFSKLHISTDSGDTWTTMERPSYPVLDIRMESKDVGFATRIDMGAFSSALQWTQYDAASKSWKEVFTAPKVTCERTLRDANGRDQFCVTVRGTIFRVGTGGMVPEYVAD